MLFFGGFDPRDRSWPERVHERWRWAPPGVGAQELIDALPADVLLVARTQEVPSPEDRVVLRLDLPDGLPYFGLWRGRKPVNASGRK